MPLIGHALALRRRPLEFLASLPASDDLIELRLGARRLYVITDPALIRRVLADNRTFDKTGRQWERARKVAGTGLATCPHAPHRRLRRLVQPAFHRSRIPAYAAMVADEVETVIASWGDRDVVDVDREMYDITARVAARVLFAADMGADAVADLTQSLSVALDGMYRRVMAPVGVVERLPTPANRRFDAARRRLEAIVQEVIASGRSSGTDHRDLLSTLLARGDEPDGDRLSDQEIHDQVSNLLLAGTETTAAALAWTTHLLMEHDDVQDQLHAELDAVLEGGRPAADDLPRLDLTRRIITEALRLYPPTPIVTRVTTARVELAGRRFPPGTLLLISPYVTHRRPDLFPEPERFDPDRWRPERAAAVPRGAMVPFGSGARKCIADDFAMMEATIALASIAQRWHLDRVEGATFEPRLRMSLHPRSLRVALRQREAWPHVASHVASVQP